MGSSVYIIMILWHLCTFVSNVTSELLKFFGRTCYFRRFVKTQNIVNNKYGKLVTNNFNEYIVAILWWMSLKFSRRSKER